MLAGAHFAAAQNGLDVYFGGGVATNSSSNQLIDTFGTGNAFATPNLNTALLKFGANAMITPHFGFGGQLAFQPGKSDYAGLQFRPMFYDFNAIVEPTHASKRVVPQLQAGIGGVALRFYFAQQGCSAFSGCSTQSSLVDSSNHFQVHFGGGVKLYATEHIYFEPQVEAHWVNNFFQFGSNWVPQYSVTVGYHLGER
jgi:hypothetical protein